MTYSDGLADFLSHPSSSGWRGLEFFRSGQAQSVVRKVDERLTAGAHVLPPPGDVFNALRLTTPENARIVILGQDPYPTPGHAHGLAFSYLGDGPLPASLRNIFKELAADLGGPLRTQGDLSDWARQGVLLINTALTVEEKSAGAHAKFGWQALTEQAVRAVSDSAAHCAFILWGAKAIAFQDQIDRSKHLILASAHPSPLSAHNGFFGSKPFSRANDWLEAKGLAAIDWRGG